LFVAALLLLAVAAGCASPKAEDRTDPEVKRMAALGHGAFERGRVDQASELYNRALERARLIDDPVEIARNAYNLAACQTMNGQYGVARALLAEARGAYLRMDEAVPPDVWLLEARIARYQGQRDKARELTDKAFRALARAASAETEAQLHLLSADLACDAGDYDKALSQWLEARDVAGRDPEAQLYGLMAGVRGRIYDGQGKSALAAGEYDEAVKAWQQAGAYGEMARSLQRAGAAYTLSGDRAAAADRYFRSARSLRAQGAHQQARALWEKARAAAEQAGDPALRQRIDSFQDEFSEDNKEP
jgi:tetratricopeptide (TPR) repeat protein